MRSMIVFLKKKPNLWKFKQILKILFTNLKVFKIFLKLKENVNKHFEKLNENDNFLLLSILIASWCLGCSPSFAIVPGFRGKASPFPSPPLVYTVQCTMKLPNFSNFQSNANKYAIDLYCISTRGGKIMRVVLTCNEWNH